MADVITRSEAERMAYEERTGDTQPYLYTCMNDACPSYDVDLDPPRGGFRVLRREWDVPTRWDEIQNPDDENCPSCGRKGEPI